MKALERFRQGGGLRLAITFIKMGLFPDMLKAGFNILIKGDSYKRQYAKLRNKVEPILAKEFNEFLAKNKTAKEPEHNNLTNKSNKYVWFCWLQGMDKAPGIVKACLESQKRWLKEKTFVIITAYNYTQYISLPQHIEEKYAKQIIPNALFSDLIRVELLTKYGGTWIDSTVMITGNNYPKEIFDCPIFLPRYFGPDGTCHGVSNWMITADRGNHLLLLLKEMLFEYWRRYDCVVDYYIFHFFFSMIARNYPKEVARMPILNSYHCIELLNHLQERGQADKLRRFLSKVSIHKLSYRLNKKVMEDEENVLHELLRTINQV